MSLDDVRRDIDRIDDQIVGLLAQRQQHVERAAAYKSDEAEVRAPERRVQMMERLHGRALENGVDPGVVALVYGTIVDAFVDLERREHATLRDIDRSVTPRTQRVGSGSPFEASIGFSRALRTGGGRVLVSGTGPVWPDGSCPEDAATQARRCFQIITDALTAVGAGLADVVRTRMFLTDSAVADEVGSVHGQLLADARPAATMLVVAGLLDPRWKVEIEVEAEVGGRAAP